MNLYAHDLSVFDFPEFSDLITPYHHRTSSSSISLYDDDDDHKRSYDDKNIRSKAIKENRKSPPRHRHDGTSPLPFGMDWSAPPRKWVLSFFYF